MVGDGVRRGGFSARPSLFASSSPAQPPAPPTETASTSVTDIVDGSHHLKVSGYSLLKGMGIGKYTTSDTFSVGGYDWAIYFYPDGKSTEDAATYVSLYIALASEGTDVRALFELTLLDQSGRERHKRKVTFLDLKPHRKGIINSRAFMPWAVITGGSDHVVILWQEVDSSWKHKTVHAHMHSSAVTGVAGLYQKKTILSVGADKRIIAFDLSTGRSEFRNQIESKCMSVLPNPPDLNLYMVQSGISEIRR